jgi:hypothetical protein
VDDLANHRIGIEDLARRERVTEKTFSSDQKRRSKSIAEGVAIGDYIMVFEKANGELALVSDFKQTGDENAKHYTEKLYRFAKRLEDAFGGEFSTYIPRPGAAPDPMQETLDLF